jgi:hypothetical protein
VQDVNHGVVVITGNLSLEFFEGVQNSLTGRIGKSSSLTFEPACP